MANLSIHPKTGKYRIRFTIKGQTKTILLVTADRTKAQTICNMVERAIEQKKTGEPDRLLSNWLKDIPDDLRGRLEKVGLVEARTDQKTLADLKSLIEKLPGNLTTKSNRNQMFNALLDFKPAETRLQSFTRETAADFCVYMRKRFKGGESAERQIRGVKGFFKQAVLSGWLQKNPLEHCKTSQQASDKPVGRITVDDLQTVLDACPNKKWQAIICLMRFAGLRGADELRGLDWSVDTIRWGTADTVASITVRPTKQAHIDKRKERIIPIPPIVETVLLDWLKASKAEEKDKFPYTPMFPDITEKMQAMEKANRKPEVNLNTPIKKIFNRAGVPITVAYDLRKNCCSDWLTPDENGNTVDIMVYEQMAGHTFDIGRKHYQQLFPGRLEKGLESVAKRWQNPTSNVQRPTGVIEIIQGKSAKKEQNPTFQTPVEIIQDGRGRGFPKSFPPVSQKVALRAFVALDEQLQSITQPLINKDDTQETEKPCNIMQGYNLSPTGIEPVTCGLEVRCSIQLSHGDKVDINLSDFSGLSSNSRSEKGGFLRISSILLEAISQAFSSQQPYNPKDKQE